MTVIVLILGPLFETELDWVVRLPVMVLVVTTRLLVECAFREDGSDILEPPLEAELERVPGLTVMVIVVTSRLFVACVLEEDSLEDCEPLSDLEVVCVFSLPLTDTVVTLAPLPEAELESRVIVVTLRLGVV